MGWWQGLGIRRIGSAKFFKANFIYDSLHHCVRLIGNLTELMIIVTGQGIKVK